MNKLTILALLFAANVCGAQTTFSGNFQDPGTSMSQTAAFDTSPEEEPFTLVMPALYRGALVTVRVTYATWQGEKIPVHAEKLVPVAGGFDEFHFIDVNQVKPLMSQTAVLY